MLLREGTAENVSRDQILRGVNGDMENIFSFQLSTTRIGNLTWLIFSLATCNDHTYIMARIFI